MSKKIYAGTRLSIALTFKTAAGVLTNPSALTVQVRKPAGTVTSYTLASPEITPVSTGVYDFSIIADAAGEWAYDVEATGAVTATSTGTFEVSELRIP